MNTRQLATIVVTCLAIIAVIPPSISVAATGTSTSIVIPYESTGWKYQQVAPGGDDGFQAPSYADSSWQTGQAGFGTTDGTCSWNNVSAVHTNWDSGTDMLVRHHFAVPAGYTDLHISGTVDNDATIYVNGHQVGPTADSGFCASDAIEADIPVSDLVSGNDNVLAIRGHDDGSATFLDVQLTAKSELDAGTFIDVRFQALPRGGQLCTTGFNAFRSAGGAPVATGAKHCLTGEGTKHTRPPTVAADSPFKITTSDGKLAFTAALQCGVNAATQCFLPSGAGDMWAWEPDSAIPSGKVQTQHGLLPVLDAWTVNEALQSGQELCHYGAGSASPQTADHAEHCGHLWTSWGNPYRDSSGNYAFSAYGATGDSGGPVYVYQMSHGKYIGVHAVGMALSAYGSCHQLLPLPCQGATGFAAIGDVLAQLQLTSVITAPALPG